MVGDQEGRSAQRVGQGLNDPVEDPLAAYPRQPFGLAAEAGRGAPGQNRAASGRLAQ
jgi:hypothetical protein